MQALHIPPATRGGAATHTLITAELPSHNHTFTGSSANTGWISADHSHYYTDYYATTTGGTAITVAQLASHNHGVYARSGSTRWSYSIACGVDGLWDCITSTTSSSGSSSGHSHGGANAAQGLYTGGVSANHYHSVTAAGSIGNTGSGTAFSVMNPYLVVYMWKRTA